MNTKNKKGLIVGLTVGIPAVAGLATALGVCVRCSTEEFITIPSDKLNISGDTLKGLKENADVSKYTTLEIPSEVRNIEKSAFKDVFKAGSTVTTVKFNKNVRKLGDSVFENCAGITTFDLTDIDEETIKFIDWGNNMFGSDETTKPVYINIKFNETLSDTAKETLKNKLLAAGVPAASFAQKVTDKVEVATEQKSKEVSDVARVEMTLTMTEEEKLSYIFKASAERDGGTPGVGVKLGEVKVEEITNDTKKYKATVDAEMVNAKNDGDYVTYKIDMIAMSGEEVKWVQTIENFKLVYNKDTPPAIVHVTGVTLDQPTLTIDQGNEATLVETVLPSNATDKSVTWTSDNPQIASVVEGKVTGVGIGTTNIKVKTTDGDFEASCAVTVEEAPAVVEYKFVGYKEDGTVTTVESEIAYYSISNDNTEIYEGRIVIPSTHNGKPVKVIDTFKDTTELTNLTIPASVETIKEECFVGCAGLTSVTFKDLTGWTLKKPDAKKTWYTPTTDVAANAEALVTTYNDRTWTKGVEPMKSYTVSFTAGDGGTLEGSTSPVIVEEGTKWSEMTTPSPKANKGFVFTKWVDQDGVEITANTQISKDTQAKAEFESGGLIATFSGSQNINQGDGGKITVKLDGETVTGCKFTSSNSSQIPVDSYGNITTKNTALGSAVITITYNGKSTTLNLTTCSWNKFKVTLGDDGKYYVEKNTDKPSGNIHFCSKYVDENGDLQDLHFKAGGFKGINTSWEWYWSFEDGFDEIPEGCFEGIKNEYYNTVIVLPKTVNKIGPNAFKGAKINNLSINGTNTWYVNNATKDPVTIDSNFPKYMTTSTHDYCKYGIIRDI